MVWIYGMYKNIEIPETGTMTWTTIRREHDKEHKGQNSSDGEKV